MNQYIYQPEQIGLKDWPSGTLRLEGIEVTDNPQYADVFTVPGALTSVFPNRESLYRLPYFRGREDRHVIMDCSDNEPVYDLPCLFIRCNTRDWYLKSDENTISWPWPVENFAECVDVPPGGFRYDVSFHGWLSTTTRTLSADACKSNPRLKSDIATYSDFCGYIYHQPEGVRRRAEFRRSMRESRLALCPESIAGVFPYRFFEAMSAGRVPVLVGSDYVLPFGCEIPYSEFTLFVERFLALRADLIIEQFLEGVSDEELIRRGRMARDYWLKYLNRDDWPRTMAYAVSTKLEKWQIQHSN